MPRHRLAIDGGPPVRSEPWPSWPRWGEAEKRALEGVLRSGRWGAGGKLVPEAEARFAALHGARYGVACCNGTMALQAALVAAGVGSGDEVVTTPYTFAATALAPMSIGAVPVFADVERGTHNLDPAAVEEAVTERTAAILPVHIGGRPADMDRLGEVARRYGIPLVEDAAQAWLASWRGRGVGAFGAAGAFSFQSSKNLTAGEGGMVLTADEEAYRRAKAYSDCGREPGGVRHEHPLTGLNLQMAESQAALLLCGLDRLPEEQAVRREAMEALAAGLAEVDGVLLPDADDRITGHGCHIFMIRLRGRLLEAGRARVIEALRAEGIPAHPGYTKPLYRQGFVSGAARRAGSAGGGRFAQRPHDRLPVCEEICRTTVWIKHEVLLAGADQMRDVTESFAKVAEGLREPARRRG